MLPNVTNWQQTKLSNFEWRLLIMFVISVHSCKNNEPNFFESNEALTFLFSFVFIMNYLIICMCIGIINLSLNYAKFYPKTVAKTIWFLMPFVFTWTSEQTATPARTLSISGLKSQILKLTFLTSKWWWKVV